MQEKFQAFVARVLNWGSSNRRDFPWRRTRNAFHILVAELLLQRTNARQVEPVYLMFVSKYASPKDIDKADLKDVAKDLQSLGLSYRAPRLKQIAQVIEKEFSGKVPASEDKLLQLPGVGKYVANAVQCFAFNKNVPLVDTNIIRVIKRVFSLPVSKESHKKAETWAFMTSLMPKQEAREFNLSILDFASLICTAKNPKHESCPLQDVCNFYRQCIQKREVNYSDL